MEFLDIIKNRRSVRTYSSLSIEKDVILNLINAAGYAPSGKNLQPWRFVIVGNSKEKEQIARLSKYESWLKHAPYFILVFLDNHLSYERIKDIQSIGACIQNILLSAHAQNIGACWVGEIIEQGEKIKKLINVNEAYFELMALITIGHIKNIGIQRAAVRRAIDDNILLWIADEDFSKHHSTPATLGNLK